MKGAPMSLSGREAAAAVRLITRQLDTDANAVLRRTLDQPVADLFRDIGLPTDPELRHLISRWISHGTSPRSLDKGTSRLVKEAGFQALTLEQRHQLSIALASQGDSRIGELLITRQRRRNVHSQVRSVLRVLDADWLSRHMDEFSPDVDPTAVLARAHRLNTVSLPDEMDYIQWSDELASFYSDIISSGRSNTNSPSSLRISPSTARTYRSSWMQFWKELGVKHLLTTLDEESILNLEIRRLFDMHDLDDLGVQLHITRSDAAADLGAWQRMTTPSTSISERAFADRMRRHRSSWDDGVYETKPPMLLMSAPLDLENSMPVVRASVTPDGDTTREYSTQWSSIDSALDEFAGWVATVGRLASDVGHWALQLTVDMGQRPFTIKHSGLPSEAVAQEAISTLRALRS